MKNLLSIRERETTYRNVMLIVVIISFMFSAGIYYMSYLESVENKKNIYVLVNDKTLVSAQATDITNSTDILTRGAVENIHKLIYEQVPDPEQINQQLKQATIASDKYTYNFIDALKEKQFYQIVLGQNYFTLLNTDSININYNVNPHKFYYKGTLKIFRESEKSLRNVETEGYVQYTGRSSKNNERGFIISKIKLLADREIKNEY